jgi:ELWxxDGT repeat protein
MKHLSISGKLLCLIFCLLLSEVTFAQLAQTSKHAAKKQVSTAATQITTLNRSLNTHENGGIKSKYLKNFDIAGPIVSSPTSVSASPASICVGSNVSLTATCSSGTVTWYNQASGGTAIGTGSPLSQSPTVTTTYYASCFVSGAPARVAVGTGESSRVSAGTVTVTSIPSSPTSVSVSQTSICVGGSISLTATCSTGTVTWYNQASGGTAIGTGTGLSQSPTDAITYYASCKNGTCESSRIATNSVTVISLPATPTDVLVDKTSICSGAAVTLTANCSTGTITWYNQETGGSALGTGSGLSQSPTENTTYYAACAGELCESARVATGAITVVTMPGVPTDVLVNQTSIFIGGGVNLTASCSSGTVTWYNQASEGSAIGTGSGLNINSAVTTTYYASCKNGDCESNRVACSEVTVVNLTDPTAVSVNKTTIVSGAKVTLSATCSAGKVVWYNQATGGNDIGGGTSVAYYPARNTTFYAACRNGIYETARVATSAVSVVSMPGLPYMVSDTVNPGETSSELDELTNVNGTMFFIAENAEYGRELWKTDGTLEGTMLVKDINPGPDPSYINSLKKVGNLLFFAASDGVNGNELWISNGEADGTVMVKGITAGITNTQISELTDVNGTVYFAVNDEEGIGKELWKSDGTTSGTVLVKDIWPGSGSADVSSFVNVNGTLFFTAIGEETGRELWKSDGSSEGTMMVKDINSTGSSNPYQLTNVNGILYFVANDDVNGMELWQSNGTPDGTTLVKDINSGSGNTTISGITAVDSIAFMAVTTSTYGKELWRSNGTPDGTYLVKDIREGSQSSNVNYLVNKNGVLYFAADDGTHGMELWKSNGTDGGTAMVKDIWEGSDGSIGSLLVNSDGTLYFGADDGMRGTILWKSDGTLAGTDMVKDISKGPSSLTPEMMKDANGKIYFKSSPSSGLFNYGAEMWSLGTCTDANAIVSTIGKTNYFNAQQQVITTTETCHCDIFNRLMSKIDAIGTNPVSGTIDVREWNDEEVSDQFVRRHYEINPVASPATSTAKVTLYFTQADFNAYNAAINAEAPKLPADSSDTAGIANLGIAKYAGKSNDEPGLPDNYTNGFVWVNPIDSDIIWNSELQRWEVSFETTGFGGFFVKGLTFGIPEAVLASSTNVCQGQTVTLTASCAVGNVVWYNQLVNGSPIGTGSPFIHTPENEINGYYAACETNELKSSRISTGPIIRISIDAPTAVVVDKSTMVAGAKVTLNATCSTGNVAWYNQSTGGNAIGFGTSVAYYPTKNTTFYATCQSGICETVRVSTPEVVVTAMPQLPYLVSDLVPGEISSAPDRYTNLNGSLFFAAVTEEYGKELWKSDGSAEGTVMVKDINPGEGAGAIDKLTKVGKLLFFTANDGIHGRELWVSNGETSGTFMISEIITGVGFPEIDYITDVNGTAFFTTNKPTTGFELWKSDGTPEGTMIVKEIVSGNIGGDPNGLTNVNGVLFFTADDGVNGRELWKSDGTVDGTVLVKNIAADGSSEPDQLTNVNGILYFYANDNVNGTELWRSDGTETGTFMVKDINSGPGGVYLHSITELNGIMYMVLDNGINGEELWRSDGTPTGTYLVKDIREGSDGSGIQNILSVNGKLYFVANDGVHGEELWRSNGTADSTVLVKDIHEGNSSGLQSQITESDGTVYFIGNDGIGGDLLWKSDGSADGTVVVKDIATGPISSRPTYITDVNGKLYFKASPESNPYLTGDEVWSLGTCTEANKIVSINGKTDYFNNQTQPTADTLTCQCDMYNKLIATIKATGANPLGNGTVSKEWIDETATAAYVKRHYEISNPDDAVSQAGGTGRITLYFTQADFDAYNNAVSGDAPKLPTNGEDASGKVHLNIAKYTGMSGDETGAPESYSGEPVMINPENSDIVWNSTLERWEVTFATVGLGGYFVKGLALGGPTEVAVNKTVVCAGSDVSLTASCETGTVTWYNQASGGSAIGTGSTLAIAIGTTTTYYAACEEDGVGSDRMATNEVTTNPVPNEPVGVGVSIQEIVHGQSVTLYAICNTGSITWYNQISGGAAIGTGNSLVYYPGSTIAYFATCKTSDCESGRVGTPVISVTSMDLVPYMVKNINTTANANSAPGKFVTINGTMYFVATDATLGKELWKTDGTQEGTTLVKDITSGGDSDIDHMTHMNGTLYFSIKTANYYELWKSDGSADGTVKVKDVWAVGDGQNIASFRVLNNTLYFVTLNTDNNVAQLWKSNGSSAGTVMVMNIDEEGNGIRGNELVVMNNVLYFQANTTDYGTELWKTDGTTTEIVKDIRESSGNSKPQFLTNVNGTLYFAANDGVNGVELWKSDGTADGTVLVKHIRSGSNSSDPGELTNINGQLYFTANNGTNGVELWKSDGTADGTVMVKDIASGGANSSPNSIMHVNETIYFLANTAANGFELWKTDGTSDGTMLVKDIKPGSGWSFTNYLTNLNGKLYFTADNGVNGAELWTSDGTEAGTVMVKEIYAGSTGASPNNLIVMNGKLYYSARTVHDNVDYGYELWSLGSCTSNNQLVNAVGKSPYYNSQTQPGAAALTCHCSVFNGLISAVEATGANQVSGVVDAKEWVEETAPVAYVRRHYELNPATNATTATGKVTLYFTQTDFDAYYAANSSRIFNIPLDHCDIDGIRNIRIIKRAGSSSDGSGLPGTYSGPMTIIDPADEDIFWSNDKQSWVVSFATTGFGGYFLKAQEVETPDSASVNRTAICSGATIELTATCMIGTVVWYNQASGGSPIGTSLSGTSSTLSQSPTVTTTYYAACKSGTYMSAERKATDAVVVTTQPTNPTSVSVNNTAICSGTSVSLSATCATGTIVWYNQATGGTAIGTGNSLSQTPTVGTTTYYATCKNGNCESSRVATAAVVVTAMPTNPTGVLVNNTSICNGESVSLTATCATGTVKWFTRATGGTPIGTGSPFSQSPTVNTTYYASCINGDCVSGRVSTSEITVKVKPATPVISGLTEVCAGTSVQLTVSIPNEIFLSIPNFQWTGGRTGGAVTVTPSATTSYRVVVVSDGCNSDSSDVFTLYVTPIPEVPVISADNNTICKGSSVVLTGSCPGLSDAFYWSVAQLRPNVPINPNNERTRVVTEPGTYKGYCQSYNGCKSAETSITITEDGDCGGQNFIKVTPEKPVVCPNTSVTLSATGCAGTLTWTIGTSTKTGTSVSVTPSVSTTYFVQCSSGGSTTVDVTVAATNVVVNANITTGKGQTKAVESIESAKKIGSPSYSPSPNISYEAGKSIVLKPGFVVEAGSVFKAEIKGCN